MDPGKPDDDFEDRDPDDEFDPERDLCHHCGGEGWGIIGCDWDSDDPINGPYAGQVQTCPCCGGTGRAEDCVFW